MRIGRIQQKYRIYCTIMCHIYIMSKTTGQLEEKEETNAQTTPIDALYINLSSSSIALVVVAVIMS